MGTYFLVSLIKKTQKTLKSCFSVMSYQGIREKSPRRYYSALWLRLAWTVCSYCVYLLTMGNNCPSRANQIYRDSIIFDSAYENSSTRRRWRNGRRRNGDCLCVRVLPSIVSKHNRNSPGTMQPSVLTIPTRVYFEKSCEQNVVQGYIVISRPLLLRLFVFFFY